MNYLIELDDNDFSKLEAEFTVVKVPNSPSTAFVYCSLDELMEIKKMPNFVSVQPENFSSISEFKTGL